MMVTVVRTSVTPMTATHRGRRVVGGARHTKLIVKTTMPLEARRRSVVVESSFEEDRSAGGRRRHRSSRTMDDDERTTRAVRRSKDRASSVSSSSGGKKSVKRGTRQRAALESALAKKSVSTLDEKELDVMTETMSFFAMVPLTLLTFPQIWKNYVNAMAGDLAVIGAVSWQGYGAGMLGNLLLLSYFSGNLIIVI